MYASDLTHQKRAAAVFRNLQLQKEWFATGQTIHILGQKGGNDYAYMTHVEEGCIADKCWQLYIPTKNKLGNGPISASTDGMDATDFTVGIWDYGFGGVIPLPGCLDDAYIPLNIGGIDFFFNGVNYGITNNIAWSSNNALIFGIASGSPKSGINQADNKAILMGNYDRLCSGLYSVSYVTTGGKFSITKLIVSFSDYYTDQPPTPLDAGKLQIRIIKENGGDKRQWVEVGVISAPASPGYSNNPNVIYGSGVPLIDSNSIPIDQSKNSPWDITNGTRFLDIAGNLYTTDFPVAGTTLLYESDKTGTSWKFTQNTYVPV